MTRGEIITNLESYAELLQSKECIPIRNHTSKLNHAMWMCDHAIDLVRQDKLKKANRWLGFIQGILFANDIYDIEELKEHNRTRVIRTDDY